MRGKALTHQRVSFQPKPRLELWLASPSSGPGCDGKILMDGSGVDDSCLPLYGWRCRHCRWLCSLCAGRYGSHHHFVLKQHLICCFSSRMITLKEGNI